MQFRYYEIRACVECDGETSSFLGAPGPIRETYSEGHTVVGALAEAEQFRRDNPGCGDVFWTIYGRDEEGLATAIGDFSGFPDALKILNAIIAPLATARNAIREPDIALLSKVADDLDDIINQSTNEFRL